jgi:hypothetical protein
MTKRRLIVVPGGSEGIGAGLIRFAEACLSLLSSDPWL